MEITATELRDKVSEVLSAVEYRGESVLIKRSGRLVGRIVPVKAAKVLDAVARATANIGRDA